MDFGLFFYDTDETVLPDVLRPDKLLAAAFGRPCNLPNAVIGVDGRVRRVRQFGFDSTNHLVPAIWHGGFDPAGLEVPFAFEVFRVLAIGGFVH